MMEIQIHEGEGCPQCGNNSYVRKSPKAFTCTECGCELTVKSECGPFFMCMGDAMSDAKERFFLSDEQSGDIFPPVPVMISRDGRLRKDVVVLGASFLDKLEAASQSGLHIEVERLVKTWEQQAGNVPEYVGPNNTRCALCDGVFHRFKLFRRRSVVGGSGADFQVHDRCLKRFTAALGRVRFKL
jgi:hypothetical protein